MQKELRKYNSISQRKPNGLFFIIIILLLSLNLFAKQINSLKGEQLPFNLQKDNFMRTRKRARISFKLLMENYYHVDLYKGAFSVGKIGTEGYGEEIPYWINGQLLDVVIDAYNLGIDKEKNLKRIHDIYQDSYDDWGDYWKTASSDDILWWAIASYRIWEITENMDYYNGLKDRVDVVIKDGFRQEIGAVTWENDMEWNDVRAYYNSCTQSPHIIAVCELVKILRGNGNNSTADEYFQNALTVYEFMLDNLFGPDGEVYDGLHINADGSVRSINETTWTYNTGTFIGASVLLYQLTKDDTYLQNACQAAYYAKENLVNEGTEILQDETSMDGAGFRGIFCRYLINLIEELQKTEGSYTEKTYKDISKEMLNWMKINADTVWGNREENTGLMHASWNTLSDNSNPYVWAHGGAVMLLLCLEDFQQKN